VPRPLTVDRVVAGRGCIALRTPPITLLRASKGRPIRSHAEDMRHDPASQSAIPVAATGWVIPSLLAFWRNRHDDLLSDELVAWGLPMDGAVATFTTDWPVSMRLHDNVEDASISLGAWVSRVHPDELVWRDGELMLMPGSGGYTASAVAPGEVG
jgi:hypothetical protein